MKSMHGAESEDRDGVLHGAARLLRKLTKRRGASSPAFPNFETEARPTAPTSPEIGRTANVTQHATEFVAALRRRQLTGEFRYPELHRLYRAYCEQSRCREVPWNTLAFKLRYLLHHKKTYRWFCDEAGVPHRLRVYRISAEPTTLQEGRAIEGHYLTD